MLRRLFVAAALPACGVASMPATAADRIVLPPERREFLSPSRTYRLVISTRDAWKTRSASAELLDANGRPVWQAMPPHERGPRRAVVSDTGQVVLIDEWINVPSRHALMLISKDGTTLAHYAFDEVVGILGVPRRVVSEHARLGVWLSAEPALMPDQQVLELRTSGKRLLLHLADGRLTALD